VPAARVIGFLLNPEHPRAEADLREARDAADAVQQDLRVVTARTEHHLDDAFASMAGDGIGALIVNRDGFLNSRRERIIELAARHSVPAIYESREHAAAGGLMSYGTSYSETYRQAGIYAGRVLKGARPADLPVVQPTKFELVINRNTARELGLSLPPSLLARADEVVE
jgi:putative tryptophan/tyrosine transport system substrate-binding protein